MKSSKIPHYSGIFTMLFFLSPLIGQNGIEIDSVKGIDGDAIRISYADDDGIHVSSTGGDGLYVVNTGDNGVAIGMTGDNGFFVQIAGGDGLHVLHAGNDGVQISNAVSRGVFVNNAGLDGVFIQQAGQDGVVVNSATLDGIRVNSAGDNGVFVQQAEQDGVHVLNAENDGVQVSNAVSRGVFVNNAGLDGVFVQQAGQDGVVVNSATLDGIRVNSAGNDGVFVNGATGYSMNIQGDKSTSATPSGHIAQIYNRSEGNSPDVLALKVGTNGNPESGVNFITFYNGGDTAVGRIDGNGSGGVFYGTTGADFAECLPLLYADERIKEGDIVGVYEGKISLLTENATAVMVITDRPAVLGNQKADLSSYEKVSFIGQVPVNVRGSVREGDWIVASGLEDGTAIAIPSRNIKSEHRIVGRSWESNEDEKIKKVMTVVGLDHSEAKDAIIGKLEHRIEEQQRSIGDLQKQIDELKNLIIGG